MSEYKVAFTEVPAECVDNAAYGGVLIHIQPPVQLNPDAVERYLTFRDFEPIDKTQHWKNLETKDVVVLGSTPEQTTIYASISRQVEGQSELIAQAAAEKTVQLLRFMGAQAIIEHPSTPDA